MSYVPIISDKFKNIIRDLDVKLFSALTNLIFIKTKTFFQSSQENIIHKSSKKKK